MMDDFMTRISNKVLIYDGSKGYVLQQMGLKGGECPELWNIEKKEKVSEIYQMYKDAGADVIQTNTFQGNRIQLKKYGLEDKVYEVNYEGAYLAREVMGNKGYVAGSIGPTGMLFEPSGSLNFKTAYDVFAEQVKALVDGGVDLINFETFTDIAEMRAALIACKEVTGKPVICSMAYEENGRTLMGTEPLTAAITLKHLGADIIGSNCSFGPKKHVEIVKEIKKAGDIIICVKPNAGTPQMEGDCVVYKETPRDFCNYIDEYLVNGARLIGGCCGTTPEFIKELGKMVKKAQVTSVEPVVEQVLTSSTKRAVLNNDLKVGNFFELMSDGDLEGIDNIDSDSLINYAIDLSIEGFDAICFDVSSLDTRKNILSKLVNIIQPYLKEPYIFKTSNISDLEKALRLYNGRAGIVVDGFRKNTYEKLLNLADKYGTLLIKNSIIA